MRNFHQYLLSIVAAGSFLGGLDAEASSTLETLKGKNFFSVQQMFNVNQPLPLMSDQDFQNRLNRFKQNTSGMNEKEKALLCSSLDALAATPDGRNLIERAEDDLKIGWSDEKSYMGAYSHENKKISFSRGNYPVEKVLSDKFYFQNMVKTLGHELRHSVQKKEERANNPSIPGVEGYADLVSQKLMEVETRLYDTVRMDQFFEGKTLTDKTDKTGDLRFYRLLKENAKKEAVSKGLSDWQKEAFIERQAKTNYVKTLWEAPTKGYKAFQITDTFERWHRGYNIQAKRNSIFDFVGLRNEKTENQIVQKFIDEMGVDLQPNYFLNQQNIYAGSAQDFFERREESAQNMVSVFYPAYEQASQLKTEKGRIIATALVQTFQEGHTLEEAETYLSPILSKIKAQEPNNMIELFKGEKNKINKEMVDALANSYDMHHFIDQSIKELDAQESKSSLERFVDKINPFTSSSIDKGLEQLGFVYLETQNKLKMQMMSPLNAEHTLKKTLSEHTQTEKIKEENKDASKTNHVFQQAVMNKIQAR